MTLRAGGVRLVPLTVAGIAQQLFSKSRLDARGKWQANLLLKFGTEVKLDIVTMRRRWRWGGEGGALRSFVGR